VVDTVRRQIEIPRAIDDRIQQVAAERGVSVEAVITDVLVDAVPQLEEEERLETYSALLERLIAESRVLLDAVTAAGDEAKAKRLRAALESLEWQLDDERAGIHRVGLPWSREEAYASRIDDPFALIDNP
jgi:hypothetical protein